MAKSLHQVLAQIEQLQRQADALRKKEVAGVVARIQEAIRHYNLTPEELFGVDGRIGGGSTRQSRRRAPQTLARTPKYQGAEGQTWSGVGKRPRWFVEALASGKSADELLVKPAAAPSPVKKLRAKPGSARPSNGAGIPKYRSEDGRTWTGRGKRPAWFVEALQAGKTEDEMLVSKSEN